MQYLTRHIENIYLIFDNAVGVNSSHMSNTYAAPHCQKTKAVGSRASSFCSQYERIIMLYPWLLLHGKPLTMSQIVFCNIHNM